jgi:hypothetical protein
MLRHRGHDIEVRREGEGLFGCVVRRDGVELMRMERTARATMLHMVADYIG